MEIEFTNTTSSDPREEERRTEFKQREAVSYFNVYINLGLIVIIFVLVLFITSDIEEDRRLALESRINTLEQLHK